MFTYISIKLSFKWYYEELYFLNDKLYHEVNETLSHIWLIALNLYTCDKTYFIKILTAELGFIVDQTCQSLKG